MNKLLDKVEALSERSMMLIAACAVAFVLAGGALVVEIDAYTQEQVQILSGHLTQRLPN